MDTAPAEALRDPGEPAAEAIELARKVGLSFTCADVLARSGYGADERTERFLNPKLAHLTPPDAMAGRDAAVERLGQAIRGRERVVVYGDYDCDGITSTAILCELVRALGGEAHPLLASRFGGGYGLSQAGLNRVLAAQPGLIVTCDCGSADHDRVAAARSAGLDVVVIDHHLVPQAPLPATAFLNPKQPGCAFPYKHMASCGLVLLVAAGLRKLLGAELDLRRWLDLVAIGTIADVAPLTGDNRVLVRAGLGLLGAPERPGLRALLERFRRGRAESVTAEDVAFQIAPRLNAPGRLGDPTVALELLLVRDAVRAAELAAEIDQLGEERRRIQRAIIADAIAEIGRLGLDRGPGILLARSGWHPGVVGIVAGRIAELYGKPTVVVALDGGVGRGSARAPAGFMLYDSLERCRSVLRGFGGHQAAAGLDIDEPELDRFREQWLGACESLGGGSATLASRGQPLARLDPRDDLQHVVADLERLEPCGEANPAPRLFFGDALVRSVREVQGHLRIDLDLGRHRLGAFAPNRGPAGSELAGRRADVVGRLRRDRFRGGDAVELLVDDWQLR